MFARLQPLRAHAPRQPPGFRGRKRTGRPGARKGSCQQTGSQVCPLGDPAGRSPVRLSYLVDACEYSTLAIGPTTTTLVATAQGIARNLVESELATRLGDLPDHITWRVEGPFDSSYSLALLNRETARGLDALGHQVVLHSTEGPGDFEANVDFLQSNADLAEMHARATTVLPTQADVTSRNLYPPRVADMCSRLNLLHHYAWEEGSAAGWVLDFNRHLQG